MQEGDRTDRQRTERERRGAGGGGGQKETERRGKQLKEVGEKGHACRNIRGW